MLPAARAASDGLPPRDLPGAGFLAAAAALQSSAYGELKDKGSSAGLATPLYPFKDFSSLMGFDWVADFDRKYRGIEGGFA